IQVDGGQAPDGEWAPPSWETGWGARDAQQSAEPDVGEGSTRSPALSPVAAVDCLRRTPPGAGHRRAPPFRPPPPGPVTPSALGPDVSASPATGANPVAPIRLFAGTDALDHVRPIAES